MRDECDSAPALTIVITTRDEELHVGRCIDSVQGLGRVVVLDSGSVDATQQIAGARSAEVIEHPWEGYSAQKNWALDNLAADADWILFLDADEYLTDALSCEIARAIRESESSVDGF